MRKESKKVFAFFLVVCATIMGFSYVNASSKFDVKKNEKFDAIKHYEKIEKNEKGLEEYSKDLKNKNKILINENIEDIKSTITFSEPVSLDTLKNFIKTNKIKPSRVTARLLSEEGERITLVMEYSNSDNKLEEEVENVMTKLGSGEFLGYIDMFSTVDYKYLNDIENEEFVYSVDTSGDDYFTEEENGEYPHPLTWDLEDIKKNK